MLAGHAVAKLLHQNRIPWVSGVAGESYLPLLDGLAQEEIPFINTSHESGAVFMAAAHARATGLPAVVAVTRGPGASNALIGIHEAAQSDAPLVLIVGQIESCFRGRGALQEMEMTDVFKSVAKTVFEVTRPDQLAPAVAAALRKAQQHRSGPVVVSVPADHFYGEVADTALPPIPGLTLSPDSDFSPVGILSNAAVQSILSGALAARRGLIIAGSPFAHGQAESLLSSFAHSLGFGVLGGHAFPDVLSPEDPKWLGCSTIRGSAMVKQLLDEVDYLLVLGHWLGDRVTQGYRAAPAKIVCIRPDANVGWDEYLGTQLLLADPVAALSQLAKALAQRERPQEPLEARLTWIAERHTEGNRQAQSVLAASRANHSQSIPFADIIEALHRTLPVQATVVSDAGSFNDWILRYLPFPKGRRYFGPLSGSMGFALPAAMGLQLAMPSAKTVALTGDGGYLMTGMELATAVQRQLPITILLFRNGVWGSIALHQDRSFPGRRTGIQLPDFSFASLARAFGGEGYLVSSSSELEPVLRSAFATKGPCIVEIPTDPLRVSPASYE